MSGDWVNHRVDDIANVTDYVANGSFATLKKNVSYSSTPDFAILVRLVDFNNGWNGNYVYLPENSYRFLKKSSLDVGDVIISNVGANAGTVFRVPDLGKPATLGPNSIVIKTEGKESLRDFLYYYFAGPIGQNQIQSIITGSAQPKFNKTDFRAITIKIPSNEHEQRAIVHILGSLDDKIELNRRMNQTLEATARAVFKSWFVDFDPVRAKAEGRPTGLPDEIAALFPDSFENSEIGEIPKGWEVSTIGENAEKLYKGTTPRMNDVLNAQDTPSIPFLKVRNISEEGEIDLSNLDRIPRSIHEGFLKRSILKTNDVLFSIAGTIGRVSILPEELNDSNVNQAIAFVRPKKNELPSTFLRLILISDRIQDEASSRVVQGVQANVSLTVLSDLRFANPPQSIIDIWLRYFGDSFSRQELLLRESRSLSSLRDTLLPKLISGELRVPNAEAIAEGVN